MPLIHGASDRAFKQNVRTEMHHGKPQKQALAIAYAMKRRGKKMAEGGMIKGVHESEIGDDPKDPKWMLGQSHAGRMVEHEKPEQAKAEHHRVLKEMRDMKKPKLMAEGGEVCPPECPGCAGCEDLDMVGRVMKNRKYISMGGRVANEDHGPDDSRLAGFSENEFDDLALRDDLESEYTGANSGDELGTDYNDESDDVVARAMRARKQRNPRPA